MTRVPSLTVIGTATNQLETNINNLLPEAIWCYLQTCNISGNGE